MIEVRQKVFQTMRDDATMRSLLGIVTPGGTDNRIVWNYLPDNPVYPMIVFREAQVKNEVRFAGWQTCEEAWYEFSVIDAVPDPANIDAVRKRLEQLFQGTQDSLKDETLNVYLSEVADGGGDAFAAEGNRWYATVRLRLITQLVADMQANQ